MLRAAGARTPEVHTSNRQLWGVVLAGGEGMRLRPLSQRIRGDQRPKQYVPILGDRTLLRQTLDRVGLGIPPARTVVVTLRSHAPYFGEARASPDGPHVLVQPTDRGTAAGILLPIHWIARRNAGATVAVFPSDHFVSEPATLMAHIAHVAGWVDEHPERLVLLGARATSPEVEYGWIAPGAPLDQTPDRRIWTIRRFRKSRRRSARASASRPAASGTRSCFLLRASVFLRAVSALPGGGRDAPRRVV
jgi:mannose-1-phosphate guanylyltransferase